MGGPETDGTEGAQAPSSDGAAPTALLPRIVSAAEAVGGEEELPASPFRGSRGRILVVEGGNGRATRRLLGPPRAAAPLGGGLSAVLAAISPQVLLAADAVDSVHLPSATDPQTVLAHLRAAARHPGPVLIHLGGHLLPERRTGLLHLSLRDTRPSSLRTDALPWHAVAEQLRGRPLEWGTLVIADLTADPKVMPMLRTVPSPLATGLPLWAAVNSDPQQVGLFTRALVEALHGGRPGAGPGLTPEQIQHQVHSVLRPDAVLVNAHDPRHVVFRNTARRLLETASDGDTDPAHGGSAYPGSNPAAAPGRAPSPPPVTGAVAAEPRPADLPPLPADAPPPPASPPTVHLIVQPAPPPAGSPPRGATAPALSSADPLAEYREAVARIVGAADQGEHARAVALSVELEREVIIEHGPDAPAALQVRQVRAHVARLAGYQASAANLYRDVALRLHRLAGPEDPETLQAASNAEACWHAVEDGAEARWIGRQIVEMRHLVPGPDARRLRAAERHLTRLQPTTPDTQSDDIDEKSATPGEESQDSADAVSASTAVETVTDDSHDGAAAVCTETSPTRTAPGIVAEESHDGADADSKAPSAAPAAPETVTDVSRDGANAVPGGSSPTLADPETAAEESHQGGDAVPDRPSPASADSAPPSETSEAATADVFSDLAAADDWEAEPRWLTEVTVSRTSESPDPEPDPTTTSAGPVPPAAAPAALDEPEFAADPAPAAPDGSSAANWVPDEEPVYEPRPVPDHRDAEHAQRAVPEDAVEPGGAA